MPSPGHHNKSSSFWDTHPYSDAAAYNMQKWMSQKVKSQKEKVKIERAVRRAEKKLQEEYNKQMELKKAAAQKQFKKDDLGKIRSRALSRRRKKKGLKFKGDMITVEVEDPFIPPPPNTINPFSQPQINNKPLPPQNIVNP
eukprot:sb/3474223/